MYMNFQQNRTITVGAGAQTHRQTDRQTDRDKRTLQTNILVKKNYFFCQVKTLNATEQDRCRNKFRHLIKEFKDE